MIMIVVVVLSLFAGLLFGMAMAHEILFAVLRGDGAVEVDGEAYILVSKKTGGGVVGSWYENYRFTW